MKHLVKNGTAKQVVKAREKTKAKFPSRADARFVVLSEGFEKKLIPLDRAVELKSLKIGKTLFTELISSKPYIGTATRAGLVKKGIYCKMVECKPTNKRLWSKVIFTKKK